MNKLYIVGTGPGDLDWLTPSAKQAIESSTDLVAYGLYLDLLGSLCDGKTLHTKALGDEIKRAELALDLASDNKTVALISSGDIGIYAMATLVFELLKTKENKTHPWQSVELEVLPGISAMQACASRVGALLGHDFCTISLSDLLTPWETIATRLEHAGQADFVVSFYNPRSQKRDWQINYARDVLLKYRPGSTPVVLGRQLTREEESIRIIRLDELDAKDVDMFTLVSVGNSETQSVAHQDKTWLYTPRGYQKKL
jgi:precorrin-3B C17-methyltransferase